MRSHGLIRSDDNKSVASRHHKLDASGFNNLSANIMIKPTGIKPTGLMQFDDKPTYSR